MIEELLLRIYFRFTRIVGNYRLRNRGVVMGDKIRLQGIPIVTMKPDSSITVGDRVVLTSSSYRTALGVTHPVILRTMRSGARIMIGEDVGISGATICAAKSISIGPNTLIGANVVIADTDFHPLTKENRRYSDDEALIAAASISIGENVFLGTNTIVLKGVSIGANSVIGAGSVVVKDIPTNSIAAGNPCKVLRSLE